MKIPVRMILKFLLSVLTKPEFKALATSVNYAQIYNNGATLFVALGHNPPTEANPTEEETQKRVQVARDCVLVMKKMLGEGILQEWEGNYCLTILAPEEKEAPKT